MWIYKELFIATLWKVLELKPKLSSCIFFSELSGLFDLQLWARVYDTSHPQSRTKRNKCTNAVSLLSTQLDFFTNTLQGPMVLCWWRLLVHFLVTQTQIINHILYELQYCLA